MRPRSNTGTKPLSTPSLSRSIVGPVFPSVAQSVEQLPFKQLVAGSIPAGRIKKCGAIFSTGANHLHGSRQESKNFSMSSKTRREKYPRPLGETPAGLQL
jgi:hypothetical protein